MVRQVIRQVQKAKKPEDFVMDFTDKVIVITGGARGIGKAIAEELAKAGAIVNIADRDRLQGKQTAKEICQNNGKANFFYADISSKESVEQLFAEVMANSGRIDILVNNAGIHNACPVMEISLDEWNANMDVNLKGVFLCTQEALKYMMPNQKGIIVNIASGAGLRGISTSAAYSASKAGVIAFSQAVADEVKHYGIRINVICPGPVKTGMLESIMGLPHDRPETAFLNDATNFMDPKEIVGAVIFLASDLSGSMNAQVIVMRNTNRW